MKIALLAAGESKARQSHCRQRSVFQRHNPDGASFSTHEFPPQLFRDNFSANHERPLRGDVSYAHEAGIRSWAIVPELYSLHTARLPANNPCAFAACHPNRSVLGGRPHSEAWAQCPFLIPDPRTKLPFVIAELHFDPLCLCAFEGIEARPPQQ